HVEHTRLAAAHKKPMLIEKPVARTLGELAEIEAAAGESGAPCMVAENYFFKPVVQVLQDHLQRGDIGVAVFIEVNRTNRTLLEGGVHWVNLMVSLGGDVHTVLAARPEARLVAPFEDSLAVVFKFASGAVGRLLHSWNLVNRLRGLQGSKIYGTAGNILFESNGLFVLVAGRRRRLRFPGVL